MHSKEIPISIEFIKSHFGDSIVSCIENSSNSFEVKSFSLNSYKYERFSIISHQKNLYEIEMILLTDKQYLFVAKKLDFVSVHEFSQSFEVNKSSSSPFSSISFEDLSQKKPYSCKVIGTRQFVLIDNRDIWGD